MPIVLAAFGGWLLRMLSALVATRLGTWLVAAAAFIGIEFMVMGPAADTLTDTVVTHFAGLPADVAGWIGYLNFDRYLSLILSAQAAVMATRLIPRKKAA